MQVAPNFNYDAARQQMPLSCHMVTDAAGEGVQSIPTDSLTLAKERDF